MLRGGGWLVNSSSASIHGFCHRTTYKAQSEFDVTLYGLHVVPGKFSLRKNTMLQRPWRHSLDQRLAPVGVLTNKSIGSYHN